MGGGGGGGWALSLIFFSHKIWGGGGGGMQTLGLCPSFHHWIDCMITESPIQLRSALSASKSLESFFTSHGNARVAVNKEVK